MHPFIETQKEWLRDNIPPFRAGDTLRVNVRVKEGEKERIQAFEGICIARRGSAAPKNARMGTPTTTPRAYAEITCPAVGTETSTPSAISGSTPIVMNSVVPMVNPPTASARIASAGR